VASETSGEQAGQHPDLAPAGGGGESATQFGQRMEAADEQAEQYTDVEDTDPESGAAAQEQSGKGLIPNMVAAFAKRDDPDR